MSSFLKRYIFEYFNRPDHAFFRAAEASCFESFPFPKDDILDLACGDGSFAKYLLPAGTTGIDLRTSDLKRAENAGIYSSLMVADASALPFKNGSFNAVFSNCALEHMPPLDMVLSEISRVLRPGGSFVFTVPSDSFPNILLPYVVYGKSNKGKADDYLSKLNANLEMIHFLSQKDWSDKLKAVGMDLIECKPYLQGFSGYVWSVLYELFSTRFPFPRYWRLNGTGDFTHKMFKGILNGPWKFFLLIALSLLSSFSPKGGAPSAGYAIHAKKS